MKVSIKYWSNIQKSKYYELEYGKRILVFNSLMTKCKFSSFWVRFENKFYMKEVYLFVIQWFINKLTKKIIISIGRIKKMIRTK